MQIEEPKDGLILDQDGNPIEKKMSAEEMKAMSEKINAVSKAACLVSAGLMIIKPGFDLFEEYEIPIKGDITTLHSAHNLIISRLEKLSIIFESDSIASIDIYNQKIGAIIATLTQEAPNEEFFNLIDLLHGVMAGTVTAIPNEVFNTLVFNAVNSNDATSVEYITKIIPSEAIGQIVSNVSEVEDEVQKEFD
jgi:hypothetical protein